MPPGRAWQTRYNSGKLSALGISNHRRRQLVLVCQVVSPAESSNLILDVPTLTESEQAGIRSL